MRLRSSVLNMGSTFGRKNWTTSRRKRKVWQCNNIYRKKGELGCQNYHINKSTFELIFLKAVDILREFSI